MSFGYTCTEEQPDANQHSNVRSQCSEGWGMKGGLIQVKEHIFNNMNGISAVQSIYPEFLSVFAE